MSQASMRGTGVANGGLRDSIVAHANIAQACYLQSALANVLLLVASFLALYRSKCSFLRKVAALQNESNLFSFRVDRCCWCE